MVCCLHDPALAFAEIPPVCCLRQAGKTVAHRTDMESEAVSGEGQRIPQVGALSMSSTHPQTLL